MPTSWDGLIEEEKDSTSWDQIGGAPRKEKGEEGFEFGAIPGVTYEVPAFVREEGLKEVFSPPEIFASIFTGGTYAAVKIGGKTLGRAAIHGLAEAGVGTLTDVPVSLASEYVREYYGWGTALSMELAAGLAAGMTVDDFLVRKFDDIGRFIGKSTRLADLAKRSETQQQDVLDELDKLMNLGFDRGDLVESQAKKVEPDEVMSVDEVTEKTPIQAKPEPRTADDIERAARTKKAAETGQREAFERQRTMERPVGKREVPEPAKKVTERAKELSEKRQAQILEEAELRRIAESQADEEAAIAEINRLRKEAGLEGSYKTTDEVRIPVEREPEEAVLGALEKVGEGRGFQRIHRVRDEAGLDRETFNETLQALQKKGFIRLHGGDPSKLTRQELEDSFRDETLPKEVNQYITMSPGPKFRKGLKPGRPEEPAKKVDIAEREALIRKIAKEKGVERLSKEEEFQADFSQLTDEFQPKYEDEVPTPSPKKRSSQAEAALKAQKEMEEFLGEPVENFRDGVVREGMDDEVGFSDDVAYRDENFISLQDLEAEEDSARTLDDFIQDMYTVFGKKIGLTIDDITQGSTTDKVKAAERLVKDLKRHRQKAVRAGLELETYFRQLGFSDEMSQRLREQTELLTAVSEEQMKQAAKERAAAGELEVFGPGWKGSLGRRLSVEYPFRKIGAHESGFAFKNYNSLRDLYEEEGIYTIKQLTRSYGLEDADMPKVTLLAENPKHDISDLPVGKQKQVQAATERVREYLDKSFKDLNEEGILERPFPQTFIERERAKISRLEESLRKASTPGQKTSIQEQIDRANERINLTKDVSFVPIMKEWFRDLAERDLQSYDKIIRILNQKKRETPTVKWLLDSGAVREDQLDIRDMIGHYARRKGEDIANQRLLKALEDDGLAQKIVKRNEKGKVVERMSSDWPGVDRFKMPLFKDHALHPKVKDYTQDFYNNIGRRSGFERLLNSVKMAQFYNPVIMPMYDTYQTTMLHGVQGWRIPKHVKDGITSALKNDEMYREAAENGLFSKPFHNPIGNWKDTIGAAKLPMKKRLLEILNPLPWKAFKNLYNLVWDIAWRGDQMIRMASYAELKRRGMSSREAAQLAALFHGDYASLPPGTRNRLNKIFFTPTFKVVMGKLFTNMASSTAEVAEKTARRQMPGMKTRALAGGLLGAMAANIAKDMVFQSMGFEADQWGRRYTKEVETDEGPREIVVTLSDPTNLPLKYYHKIRQSFGPGQEKTAWGNALRAAKWDFHPFWRALGSGLANNERPDGSRIYSQGDDTATKGLKTLEYLTEQYIPVTQVMGLGEEDQEEKKILEDEFGWFWNKAMRLFVFPYVRKTKDSRLKYRLQNIRDSMRQDMKNDALTEERLENYQGQIRELLNEHGK